MESKEWILQLILQYISSARNLSRRLCDEFDQGDLLTARRGKAMPRAGISAGGLEFRFHGSGCWISDGDIRVDFDFMPDGQIGGFDAWRLHVFSEENPSLVGSRSLHDVQAALGELMERGLIQQVSGSSLFRLRMTMAKG